MDAESRYQQGATRADVASQLHGRLERNRHVIVLTTSLALWYGLWQLGKFLIG